MQVSGNEAAGYNAIRLDSFAVVNGGVLVSADENDGSVSWKDKAGETKKLTLGAHAIKIVRAKW